MSAPQPDFWANESTARQIAARAVQAFGAPVWVPAYDRERLHTLLVAVHRLMLDGRWRTLGELRTIVGHSEAGISARLRQIRASDAELKPRPRPLRAETEVWVVERRRRGDPKNGLHEYRMVVP